MKAWKVILIGYPLLALGAGLPIAYCCIAEKVVDYIMPSEPGAGVYFDDDFDALLDRIERAQTP